MMPHDRTFVNQCVEQALEPCVKLLQDLIRIPSVNHPPTGDEAAIQRFYANVLASFGLEVELFDFNSLPEFQDHPGRLIDHDMKDRPNVAGVLRGTGGGRSLMLLAHADTEQTGDTELWTDKNPFSGRLEDGRIYGRGAGDDKFGLAAAAIVAKICRENSIRLKGDLTIASVSDEEQGGANGTIGLLAKGYRADGGIFLDGVNMNLSITNLGGGFCDLFITVPGPDADVSSLLSYFDRIRQRLEDFKKERTVIIKSHPLYNLPEFEDMVLNLHTIQLAVEDNSSGQFRITFYLRAGEDPAVFRAQVENLIKTLPGGQCRFKWMNRFLEASDVPEDHLLVRALAKSFEFATGRAGKITGMSMCDTGMVNRYGGFPCITFGIGHWGVEGMVHQPDEFILISELKEFLKTILVMVMEWCGYESLAGKTAHSC